jgi:hypothetical protein
MTLTLYANIKNHGDEYICPRGSGSNIFPNIDQKLYLTDDRLVVNPTFDDKSCATLDTFFDNFGRDLDAQSLSKPAIDFAIPDYQARVEKFQKRSETPTYTNGIYHLHISEEISVELKKQEKGQVAIKIYHGDRVAEYAIDRNGTPKVSVKTHEEFGSNSMDVFEAYMPFLLTEKSAVAISKPYMVPVALAIPVYPINKLKVMIR